MAPREAFFLPQIVLTEGMGPSPLIFDGTWEPVRLCDTGFATLRSRITKLSLCFLIDQLLLRLSSHFVFPDETCTASWVVCAPCRSLLPAQ